MLSRGCYPEKDDFEMTKKLADDGLDFYFVQCSMLVDVEGLARFGAMLANNGINPSTGERILHPETVKKKKNHSYFNANLWNVRWSWKIRKRSWSTN